jgi:pimeloyl-ACP methyl ester carboxylesterase
MRPVVFLPGGTTPAEPTYRKLLAELAGEIEPLLVDHAIYETPRPPRDWTLGTEVAALARAADGAGFDGFHVVAFCAGAVTALVFAATYPGRLCSLTLVEPARIGRPASDAERAVWERLVEVARLPEAQMRSEFVAVQLGPGVEPPPPPPEPAPPWMAKRPAALAAFIDAFDRLELDPAALRRCMCPVLVVRGGRSHRLEVAKAERLLELFPDARLAVFDDANHFDPPHRREPARFARVLREHWARADAALAAAAA